MSVIAETLSTSFNKENMLKHFIAYTSNLHAVWNINFIAMCKDGTWFIEIVKEKK